MSHMIMIYDLCDMSTPGECKHVHVRFPIQRNHLLSWVSAHSPSPETLGIINAQVSDCATITQGVCEPINHL